MNATLTLLLLAFLPTLAVPSTRVDVIELNRFVNERGNTIFDCYNFWTYHQVDVSHGYHVVDWRLKQHVAQYPEKIGSRWVLHWFDDKTRRQYRVVGRVFRPTISNFDPELRDRDELPEQYRMRLAGDPSCLRREFSVLLRGRQFAE